MKGESITAVMILFALGIIFISLPIKYGYDKLTEEPNASNYVEIDWEELYPFDSELEVETKNENEEWKHYFFLEFYRKLCAKIVEKGNNLPQRHLFMKNSILETYGRIQKLLGMKIVKDTVSTVISAGNGYWLYQQSSADTNASFHAVKELNDWLLERGIEFIFVQAPTKLLNETDTIKSIIDNYSISDKDILCNNLKQAGVDVLDIRSFMPQDYNAYMEKFFKTDHHWKPSTGLWATSILADKLNNTYGFQIDTKLLQIKNYKIENYPSSFLGSEGKKATIGYSCPEDMELIIPKFEHSLTVSIPQQNIIEKKGDFSLLLNKNQLKQKDFYESVLYSIYTYGDQPLITITNENAKSKKRILFLKDSFANVVTPYVSLVCKQVDILDLRHFKGSLKKYLEENTYDMVIFLINSTGNNGNINFSKHDNLWDFR